jgi:hypothetical protein
VPPGEPKRPHPDSNPGRTTNATIHRYLSFTARLPCIAECLAK